MAGKNQPQRIRVIDKFLSKGRKYTWEDLRECILTDQYFVDKGIEDISRRTILDDIAEMRNGYNIYEPAPIPKGEDTYYYSKEFNLFKNPIKEKEAYILMNALDILNQFPDFEHSEKVKAVVEKLRRALDITENGNDGITIDFEKVDYPAAGKWISKLYPHLKERNSICISYKPYSMDSPYEVNAIPLLLKEYNGRWFLIAYNLDKEAVHNFALDRVSEVKEVYIDTSSIKLPFDPEEYFRDLVGVTLTDEGPQEIQFQCSEFLFNYFKTKSIHHSQECIDEDARIFQIYCHCNIELIAKFLSYGEGLEVLSPNSLRDQIKRKVEEMRKKYLL